MDLIRDIRHILQAGSAQNQEALCEALQNMGHTDINQSKVSRLLRKLGAAKVKNEHGVIVYRLPKEPAPPTPASPLSDLILEVTANETTIVITTSPGSAQLVARLLDYNRERSGVLGSVAGDDTVIVIPQSIKNITKTLQAIQEHLYDY